MRCDSPRFIDSPLCWSPLVHIKNRTGERPTYAFDILGTASNAVNDDQGNYIPDTYATKSEIKKSNITMDDVNQAISDYDVNIQNQLNNLSQTLMTLSDRVSSIELMIDAINIRLESLDRRVTELEGN